MSGISFALRPHPPFSLELTAWALRRRAANQIDRWDGRRYSRIFVLGDRAVHASISQDGGIEDPKLNISVAAETADFRALQSTVSSVLERMFSLRSAFKDFYSLSVKDERLRPLLERYAGLKPPRFPTVFEALVNAISCQQVSLDLGIILLNRLSGSYGAAFGEGDTVFHAFPRPQDLAGLSPGDLRKLGFSRNKGRAIIELSERVSNGELKIESLEERSDAEIVHYLSEISGVGRWSAEYVLLRGLGRMNMFPGDDVGAQRNLQSFMGLNKRPDYGKIKKITSQWQPYAGFVYFYFLLDALRAKGELQ
ncbi:MAG: DNA-3-methyladenine glycosylase family protein [bacterium]